MAIASRLASVSGSASRLGSSARPCRRMSVDFISVLGVMSLSRSSHVTRAHLGLGGVNRPVQFHKTLYDAEVSFAVFTSLLSVLVYR